MTMNVKDAAGAVQPMKTTLSGGEHVVHHIVESVAQPVPCEQSGVWSMSISGLNTITPGSGLNHLGKDSGTSWSSGATGTLALAVRKSTPGALIGSDGLYGPLQTDQQGRLYVSSVPSADGIEVAGAVLPVKTVFLNLAANTADQVLVAAVATKKLRVIAIAGIPQAAAVLFALNTKPAGAGTAITPSMSGSVILPINPFGWCETVAGEVLTATTLTAAALMGIIVHYVEVPT